MNLDKKINNKMIFVVGNSRSGTTLMGEILGLNTQVFTFEELHFFGQLWLEKDKNTYFSKTQAQNLFAKLISIQNTDYLTQQPLEKFKGEAIKVIEKIYHEQLSSADIFKHYLNYETSKQNKQTPLEQTPRNVLYIKEILELYPEALIVNMIRDPRDVLLSQKYKWKIKFLGANNIPYKETLRSWLNYHPITISKLWNASIKAADKFLEHPRVYSVKFEDLVTQSETIIKNICDFVGIEFQSQMLEVSHQNSSHQQRNLQNKGIDPKVIEKWKKGGLSKTEIYICQKITDDNMKNHNYEISSINVNIFSLFLSYLFFPAKISLALVLNIRRTKNIIEALKRRL